MNGKSESRERNGMIINKSIRLVLKGKFSFFSIKILSGFLVFPFFFFSFSHEWEGGGEKENEFVLENRMEQRQKLDETLPVISLDMCHSMSSLTLEC